MSTTRTWAEGTAYRPTPHARRRRPRRAPRRCSSTTPTAPRRSARSWLTSATGAYVRTRRSYSGTLAARSAYSPERFPARPLVVREEGGPTTGDTNNSNLNCNNTNYFLVARRLHAIGAADRVCGDA